VVKIGSGVGGSVVVDGRLHRGAHGYAGEIGHATVDVASLPAQLDPAAICGCKMTGHLQCYVRVEAVAERVMGRKAPTGNLYECAQNLPESPEADAMLVQVGDILASALVGPIMVIDPDVVIFRMELGPADRRQTVLDGVRARMVNTLPPPRPIFTEGTAENQPYSLLGAAVYARDAFVRQRLLALLQGSEVPGLVAVR
jgi:glucokinase